METILIDARRLLTCCADILCHQGIPPADADFVSQSLVEADLRGIHSHGVLRLGRYIRELRSGVTNPHPTIQTINQGIAYACVDGDGGLGPLVGRFAMQTCLDKARECGSAVVTACRSRHFGAAGFYALRALEFDLIGMAMTVASPRLAPTGGRQALFGNNPIAVAVPGDQEYPLLIDFAAGQIAAGRLELAVANGQSIPEGLARDHLGNPTTDPSKALKGSILPIGEHKGYCLTLLIEILAGLLSGAPYFGIERNLVSEHLQNRGIGHLFIAIDPARFMPLAQFKANIASMTATIKASPRLIGIEEIFFPGELEGRRHRESIKTGIPMAISTVQSIKALARECAVEWP